MTIRPARTDDHAALAELAGELGYPSSTEQVAARLRAIDRSGNGAVLVAEDDARVVAWLHVFASERLETDTFAEIGGLVVASTARGRGVGERLVHAAAEWARERTLTTLRVRSNVIRHDAHRFYERLGFTRTKDQAVFSRECRSTSRAT